VLNVSGSARIYLAAGVTDMRKSFNGLYALAKGQMGGDVLQGHLFLFCNRRRDRLKALFWDGHGLWVCAKRLEKGTFAWPQCAGQQIESVELSRVQLNLLLGGLDLRSTRKRNWLRTG
jgi:transposase